MTNKIADKEQGVFRCIAVDFTELQKFTQRNWDIISIINVLHYNGGYECIYYAVKEAL